MTTLELLEQLRSLDIRLWLDGDQLRFDAPAGAMSPPLRAQLREQKAEIIAFLREADRATRSRDSIERIPRDGPVPVSFAQQRLWFLEQLEPGGSAYNLTAVVRLLGALDLDALERSFNSLVARHETLRTTFAAVDGEPVQVIAPALMLPLQIVDLHDTDDQEAAIHQHMVTDARQPFDLSRGPLVRVALLRLSSIEHVLSVTMHHIVSDGWSMGVLIREMAALYEAHTAGTPAALPDLPIQYADYAAWQRNQLQGPALNKLLAFWTDLLADAPPVLDLPVDRPRPPVQSYRGAQRPFTLPQPLATALSTLSQREGATPFMVLLAAFYSLLYRYAGQIDIVVGTPIAGRTRSETEGLIGFFINSLALRAKLAGDRPFLDLLRQVREVTLGAYTHQELPFERLVEVLRPERGLSYSPIFQVMFILQNTPLDSLELSSLKLLPVPVDNGTAKFDITLTMEETGQGLAGALEYNTDLFDAATIDRLLTHYETLLSGVAADPRRPLAALPLLTPAERRQLLLDWNATETTFPAEVLLHHLVEAQAARSPDAIALVCGPQQLTYRELDTRANQLARLLRRHGVGPEVLAGVCLERSVELVLALLGVLKAGGAYVPLDPSYPQERLAFMLEDAQVRVLLTTKGYTEGERGRRGEGEIASLGSLPLSPSPPLPLSGSVVDLRADWKQIAQEPATNPENGVMADNLAYVIYTSGSTGRPKGALNTHRAICNRLLWMQTAYGLTAADRVLQKTPYSFDVSVWEFFWPLLVGAPLVLAAPGGHQDSAYLVRLMAEAGITTLHFVPSMLQAVLGEPELARCTSLRRVICSGEALPAELARQFFERLDVELHNLYGPTEAAVDVTYWACRRDADPLVVPIGRPVANTQVYVLDQRLQPVPIGVAGELYLGGVQVGRGYLNRPELTAERFVPNPFLKDEGSRMKDEDPHFILHPSSFRLYKTGDLARLRADGAVEFLGRLDGQVKLRGFRIELGEIETLLLQHPAVRAAAVLLLPLPDPHLLAFVVPTTEGEEGERGREGEGETDRIHPPSSILHPQRHPFTPSPLHPFTPSSQELREYLQRRLPDYMLPGAFVVLEALPLTPSGKLDRRALAAASPSSRSGSSALFVAPRTTLETLLAQLWAELLGLERVGIHDHFFGLGGHSLLATRLLSRLRATLEREVPLRSLFEAPTIAQFAVLLAAAPPSSLPPLQPRTSDGPLPLSFAQERLWFLSQLEPTSPAYNLPLAVEVVGPLHLTALVASLSYLSERHAALRTSFASLDGRPQQLLHPPRPLVPLLLDLQALPGALQPATVEKLAEEEARRPFDLQQAAPLRVSLLRLAPERHVLLLTLHHIIADGWSLGLLARELSVAYAAALQGRTPDLAPLPVQYADYALWQRHLLQGGLLESHLSYWQQQLEGLPTTLALPTDRPRPALLRYVGATHSFALPSELTVELDGLGRREGVTRFMLLLAAFQVLLSRYSGQRDLAVGTPIANRSLRETEGLIGMFVNTLVLRAKLAFEQDFRTLLAQTREVCLGAYAHQELPFELLVERLGVERRLSVAPLVQVLFGLQNLERPTLRLEGLEVRGLGVEGGSAKLDLSVLLSEGEGELLGQVEYNTDLYEAATVERLVGHFVTLLAGALADPCRPLATLPLLTPAERRQLLVDWNATETAFPAEALLHHLVEAQAAHFPDAIALVCGLQQLTYRELDARANQLAHLLRRHGVGPEVAVGVCLDRTLDLVVALLSVLKAGGAYLPLDPTYPQDRLSFMLQDAQVQVLLTTNRPIEGGRGRRGEGETPQADRLPLSPSPPRPLSLVVDIEADWHHIADEATTNPDSGVRADNLAYVIYTSGSTGRPKGVAIAHRSAVALISWAEAYFTTADLSGVLAATSICFDLSIFELFVPLSCGGTVILVDDLLQLIRAPVAHPVTLVNTVPSVMAELLRAQALPDTVRTVNLAGEALPRPLADQLYRQPGVHQVVNLYGPSEDTTYSTVARVSPGEPGAPPIGRPIANTQVYVLDERMQPVPIGVAGEIYIGGAGLARGYLGRPELTAERFVPNPFLKDEGSRMKDEDPHFILHPSSLRLYKTGDLARLRADGAVEFLGRLDGQVKLRGFRIELGEIETLLLQHPAVRAAAVLLQPLPDPHLLAFVVPTTEGEEGERGRGGEGETDRIHPPSSILHPQRHPFTPSPLHPFTPSSQELREYLQRRLPDYMLPAAFVVLEALPLTPSGKLDRRALAAASPSSRSGSSALFVPPRTTLETLLAQLWAELLGLERVGIHDHFFGLGGHSLLATRLLSRLRATLEREVPLRSLFEAPTIAQFAVLLAAAPPSSLPPLQPRTSEGPLPLSFAQERLWFLSQLEPTSPAYNLPLAVEVVGALHLTALVASLSYLSERHAALRTSFASLDGRPQQLLHPPRPLVPLLLDLQALPPALQPATVEKLAEEEARRPFDLQQAAPLRVSLLRLAPERHVLLLTLHHIIADGWSLGLLARELSVAYAAALQGRTPDLAPLPVQYADYALWQRHLLQGGLLESHLSYWQQQLEGLPTTLALPTDRPRPALLRYVGATHSFALPSELTVELDGLGRREGVTRFMLLLAAFQVLLSRYSGQRDLAVGTPIANRSLRETEGLIGMFVNTLVLRAKLAFEQDFRTLLAQTREVCLGAYAHQELPFELLVERLGVERRLSVAPLVQVLFGLQNLERPTLRLEGLEVRGLGVEGGSAKLDLSVLLSEGEGELLGQVEYNTDLYEAATVERLVGHFVTLLAGALADPCRPLAMLPLLTPAECRQLLVDWNATETAFPAEALLHHLVEAQAAHSPDAIALVCGPQQLTYRELDARANQLAHLLRRHGVGPEVAVGVCLDRTLDLVVALLGVLKAGGAYLPLDPTYPAECLRYMLEDAQVQVLLTTNRPIEGERGRRGEGETPQADRLPLSLSPPLPLSLVVDIEADWHHIADEPTTNPDSEVTPENLAYVIYTSGSTGRPKGTLIRHAEVTRLLSATEGWFEFGVRDVWSLFHSVAFDFSVWEIWGALCTGGRLVVVPYWLSRDPAAFATLLAAEQVTVLNQTPAAFQQLIPVVLAEGAPRPLALRYVIFGGEALNLASLRPWFARYGEERPQLINMYGITETTVHVTYRPITRADVEAELGSRIGIPIPDLQVYLLDQHLELVPIGVPGEIYVGGAGLARGYLNRPELTAERFIPNPFAENKEQRTKNKELRTENQEPFSPVVGGRWSVVGGRLYKSGDLARRWPNGDLEYLGRIDSQVKLRGYRIELGEIAAVLRQHAAVEDALVLVREDVPGEKRLVAYLIPTAEDGGWKIEDGRAGAPEMPSSILHPPSSILTDTPSPLHPFTPSSQELRAFLKTRLPDYMVPAAFVWLSSLPLTPNGKVDRKALPSPHGERLAATLVAPRDWIELQLRQIWEAVLDQRPIGVTDNFFELGGHSLSAVRVMARIQAQFGRRLPLAVFFQGATIEQLAIVLRQQGEAKATAPLVPIQPAGSRRPLFCVHPIGGNVLCYLDLARQVGPDQPVYGLQATGLAGERAPCDRLAAMAANYVEAIRSVQPHGPYALGGWSFGGVVAFEIARQLQAQGEEIALLAMIDSSLPADGPAAAEDGAADLLAGFAYDLGLSLDGLGQSISELGQLAPEEQLAGVLQLLHIGRLVAPDLDTTQLGHLFRVYQANWRAWSSYVPQPYQGSVTLFSASADSPHESPDRISNWRALATDLVECAIPATHYTILKEPHVRLLAEHLRDWMAAASEQYIDRV